MRFVWRVLLVLAVAIGVGFLAAHGVMEHEIAKRSAPYAEERLSSWMAGLFAGGAAAVAVIIALAVGRRR